MKGMFFGAVMFIGTFTAAVGGAQLGVLSGGNFDYEAATVDERQKWLEKHSKSVVRGMKSGLRGSGVKIEVEDVDVNAAARKVTVTLQARERMQLNGRAGAMKAQFSKKMCPEYTKLTIAKARISLITKILYKNGRPAITLSITPSKCKSINAKLASR